VSSSREAAGTGNGPPASGPPAGGSPLVEPGSPAIDCDYHIHTIYSGHSGAEMFIPAVMARCAELGLRRALIVEHAPPMMSETYSSPDEWFSGRNDRTAADAILAEVRARRPAVPGVEFLVGAEIDADPEKMDGSLMLADLTGLDTVLGATHLLPGAEGFWFSPPEIPPADRRETRERWLAWMENVAANPQVDVIAHPCAELHNCGLSGDFDAEFREACEPLLTVMGGQQVAFELNEAALRRLGDDALAGYVELIKLARECGVLFTVGSDAHRGRQLGDYRRVPRVALRAGLDAGDFWHPPLIASLG
jgi:histidinol phosphatase-like PHP family hydrolase